MTVTAQDERPDAGKMCARVRDHVETLSAALAWWADRDNSRAQAQARTAANTAIDEIDAALVGLHRIRTTVINEIRESDEAAIRRVEALLARCRAQRGDG